MKTNKKAIYRFILFFVLNFGALALGGLFTNKGISSDWYVNAVKAPWTPPGWVFGAAWTLIMICFSFYMTYLWSVAKNKKFLIGLFSLQWIFNVGWNPIFFYYHNAFAGLFVIIGLTLIITFFMISYWSELKLKSIFVIPYFIWLLIATSLNAYMVFYN